MIYTVSCNIEEDLNKIKEDEQLKFTATILDLCGLDLSECLPSSLDSSEITVIMRKNLAALCKKMSVNIIDQFDGQQEIWAGGNKIAIWKKPWIEYKEDLTATDRKKRLYAQINFEFWSEFESVIS